MIKKVLIPNRGEIAVRIIKAAHQLGIQTVVTLSELEKDTLPAILSDEVHYFPDGPFKDNYLNIDGIINIAKQYHADALHPGYGFLSENHELVSACHDANIVFIGPSANNLKQMGDKQVARSIAKKADVPITESWEGKLQNLLSSADSLPYPVLIKAAMGGGGKGMQVCYNKDELLKYLPGISKQALRYFGDDRIYIEQYLPKARHIEVQVLADKKGNTIHLFERECSIQRRFQKIIEEAPAYNLSDNIKKQLLTDAIRLCKSINYESAGTVEFLVDEQGQHYFLEMNTRIQVEHCITEEITGIDLVEWQFKIANGDQLSMSQKEVKSRGHAIELRICAEDPANNFQPNPGQIQSLIMPDVNDARLEIGFNKAIEVHAQFDPMIAKLIVHDNTRNKAIKRAIAANNKMVIYGIKTNGLYLNQLLKNEAFTNGQAHTKLCEEINSELTSSTEEDRTLLSLAYTAYRHKQLNNQFWRQLPVFSFKIDSYKEQSTIIEDNEHLLIEYQNTTYALSNVELNSTTLTFKSDGKSYNFFCFEDANKVVLFRNQIQSLVIAKDWLPDYIPSTGALTEDNADSFRAPIPSQVMKVNVTNGQEVKKGDLLLVLEAMKTENHIKAWKDGVIEKVLINAGQQVKLNQKLIDYKTIE